MSDTPPIVVPEQLPMMVLPCTLFPHCLMPLFIFEQRYRDMLKRVLETDRFFCIGTSSPDADPEDDHRAVAPITTAGIVRACVTHDDGTSHLILLGARRVRLIEEVPSATPFRISRVEAIHDESETPELASRLAADTIGLTEQISGSAEVMSSQVQAHLRSLDEPSAVADVIAHNFVTDPIERQSLLETLEVSERLHRLGQLLQARIAEQS